MELSDTNHPQAHLDDSEHAAKRTFLGSVKNRVHPFVVKLNVATVTAALLAITGTAAYFVLYAGEQRQAPEINLKQIIKSNSTDQPGQVALGTTAGVVSGVQQPDAALPDHAAASTSGTSTPAAAVAIAGASSNPTAVATVAGAKDVKETTIEERNSSAEQLLALYSRVGELELQVKQMARDLNSTRIAYAKDKTAKVVQLQKTGYPIPHFLDAENGKFRGTRLYRCPTRQFLRLHCVVKTLALPANLRDGDEPF